MDLDPLEDPDPELDLDPAMILIHTIPIPALLDAIPDPDSDPAKNGIVTPLANTIIITYAYLILGRHCLISRFFLYAPFLRFPV